MAKRRIVKQDSAHIGRVFLYQSEDPDKFWTVEFSNSKGMLFKSEHQFDGMVKAYRDYEKCLKRKKPF